MTVVMSVFCGYGMQLSAYADEKGCVPPSEKPAEVDALNQGIEVVLATMNGTPVDDNLAKLEKLSHETSQILDVAGPDKVPDAVIDRLIEKINKDDIFRAYGRNMIRPDIWTVLEPRLIKIIRKLQAEGKIRYLNAKSRKNLGLEKWPQMNGFYHPLTNHLFIKAESSEDEMARILFHEALHAYQYTYRFPIDLNVLSNLAKQLRLPKGVTKDSLDKFLANYYESQANYQTMKFVQDPLWEGQFHSASSAGTKAALGGASLIVPHLLPIALLKVLFEFESTNIHLLDTDKKGFLTPSGNDPLSLALGESELTPLKDSHHYLRTVVFDDFDFHNHYTKSIDKVYGLSFLNNETSLALGNPYYKKLGLRDTLEREQPCADLVRKVEDSDTSPMVKWLELPKKEIETCSVYVGSGDEDQREAYAGELIKPSQDGKSPFLLVRPGIDGTRPGLDVQPALMIQPNLEVPPADAPLQEVTTERSYVREAVDKGGSAVPTAKLPTDQVSAEKQKTEKQAPAPELGSNGSAPQPQVPACKSIDHSKVKPGDQCITSAGKVFKSIAANGFGESWMAPDGMIWGDRLVPEHVEMWMAKNEFRDAMAAQDKCRELGGFVPSKEDFERGQEQGFREVLPHMDGGPYWSSTLEKKVSIFGIVAGAPKAYIYQPESGAFSLRPGELPANLRCVTR